MSLTELTVENLAVIERVRLPISRGFTVLTGETGAGKTMVVTSLHLLSGARADAGCPPQRSAFACSGQP